VSSCLVVEILMSTAYPPKCPAPFNLDSSCSPYYRASISASFFFRYLGFSWASGVVTIDGKPYPNGRNEESSSESISAYEVSSIEPFE
jgi:hypothetical protein